MQQRTLHRSGLPVSTIALGSGPFGNMFANPVSDADAAAAIEAAWEGGVRHFDTAPGYGGGLAEERLGANLKGLPRASFAVSTKVGWLANTADRTVTPAFTRNGVLRSIEASLSRLQMDYIDIALIHDADHYYEPAIREVYPVLDDLRRQGVIKQVGAGMNQWQMEQAFAENGDFDCFLLAGRYTLLEQGALDFLEFCRTRQIDIFLGGVFNSGILATGARPGAWYNYSPAPEPILDKVRRFEAIASRHGVPLKALTLQFPLAHPAVTNLVLGASSRAEVAENLAAAQVQVPAAVWEEIRAEGLVAPDAPLP